MVTPDLANDTQATFVSRERVTPGFLHPSAESLRVQSWSTCHFMPPPSAGTSWMIACSICTQLSSIRSITCRLPKEPHLPGRAWRCVSQPWISKKEGLGCPAAWASGPSREISSVAKSKMSMTSVLSLQLLKIPEKCYGICARSLSIFFVSQNLAVWHFPVKSWAFSCSSMASTRFASDSLEALSLAPLWAVVLRDIPSSVTTQNVLGDCATRSLILSGCVGTRSHIVI